MGSLLPIARYVNLLYMWQFYLILSLLIGSSTQVLCARSSDEEFFQIRCKGNYLRRSCCQKCLRNFIWDL